MFANGRIIMLADQDHGFAPAPEARGYDFIVVANRLPVDRSMATRGNC